MTSKIIFRFLGLILVIASCNPPEEKTAALNPDTREWVRDAFDSIDYMKIEVLFNAERAAGLKDKIPHELDTVKKLDLILKYGTELIKAGQIDESIKIFNSALDLIHQNKVEVDRLAQREIYFMMATAYLRLGEIQNYLQRQNFESCFIPIAADGIHQLPFGSQSAIKMYEGILKEFPTDLEVKYLLNIAYMTLGQYPDKVPTSYRIDPSWFKSKISMKPFKNIAPAIGVNRRGHAGGVVVDDFTNDGWLDIVITSWSPTEQLVFYLNNGDGSFTDKTIEFGLEGQVGVLNLNQTDFNNDGWLDLYLMRGAWLMTEGDIPNTLLMNTGKGSFTDVTLKAGLVKHAPGQTSAWSDFNLDGYLDLVIPNESMPEHLRGIDLYINQQDGTFKHSSDTFGLDMNHFFKGCVAADINNDRYPDLYLSSYGNGTFLLINQGGHSFVQASLSRHPAESQNSFPCWNFDYDNDGNEDLFVSGYTSVSNPAVHWMENHMGRTDIGLLPRLHNNLGDLSFKEVGVASGLTEVTFTMGCNYGDINVDGFLDFYLATGNPMPQSIVPNKMYLNMDGERFEDVSYSGGFAHIQKGNGVGFGDLDHDGDEDIYIVIGGANDGDFYHNCLFENPNESNNNWVVLKLNGTSANKGAIGARIAISVQESGNERKIFRTVTSGASFGGNSLVLEVGLRKAKTVNHVTVQWPCKECPEQTYTGIEINKAYSLVQDEKNPVQIPYYAVGFKSRKSQTDQYH